MSESRQREWGEAASIAAASMEAVIVPMDQEPNHRCVLANKSLRVFDAVFLPGAVSLYHRHEADSVFICLEGANVTSEEPGKPLIPRSPIPSRHIYYRPYARCPFIHRVRNLDSTTFRILDVEILTKQRGLTPLATLPSAFNIILDNDRVRVSGMRLEPGQTTGIIAPVGPCLWTTLEAGKLDISSAKSDQGKTIEGVAGLLHAQEGDANEVITNAGQETVELVLMELRECG